MFHLFLSAQKCHGTYLMMLNTYNNVVLGWNTTSTSFFTLLTTILSWLGLGFDPFDKQYGRYYTEKCYKY